MSLLVIDFTYLEGKDGELAVKGLATVDSHSNRVPSYGYKRSYSWEELSLFNVRMNEAIDIGLTGMMVRYIFRARNRAISRGIICCCNLLFRACKNIIY
jgi:hypothetical protein